MLLWRNVFLPSAHIGPDQRVRRSGVAPAGCGRTERDNSGRDAHDAWPRVLGIPVIRWRMRSSMTSGPCQCTDKRTSIVWAPSLFRTDRRTEVLLRDHPRAVAEGTMVTIACCHRQLSSTALDFACVRVNPSPAESEYSASEERGYVVGLTVFAGLLPPREAGFYGRITPLPAVEAPYSARPTAVVRPLPIVTNSKQRRHVIYRDSQGIRDQVVIDVACRFVDFRKLNARDTREVIEKALGTKDDAERAGAR